MSKSKIDQICSKHMEVLDRFYKVHGESVKSVKEERRKKYLSSCAEGRNAKFRCHPERVDN